MNCQKFENIVSELARGRMMAAEQRGEALAHSEACEDCAMRLRNEEMLTSGLHFLAAEMAPLAAPADIENKLLEAFRSRQVVVPISSRWSAARYWLIAVAAILLIAISVVVFRKSVANVETPHQAVRQEELQNKPPVPNKPEEAYAVGDQPQGDKSVSQRPRAKRIRSAGLRQSENAQVANHVTQEIATDFIPLSYMNAANLQDGGQIVRVQLPRSALASFGLPANMDRYNERVKADVLVGVDGLAHAIRFVQ
jgi:hypothetical protein